MDSNPQQTPQEPSAGGFGVGPVPGGNDEPAEQTPGVGEEQPNVGEPTVGGDDQVHGVTPPEASEAEESTDTSEQQ